MRRRKPKTKQNHPENWFFGSISSVFSEQNKNHHIPDALQYIASLVNISNPMPVGYVQKTTQKPKIILSAGMKTFDISKHGNKSDINETWPRSVPPEHL